MEQLFGILFSLNRGTPEHGKWILACLEGAWPKLLGNKLADVCRPMGFKGSELFVEILDGSWEKTLRGMRPEMEEKLWAATAGEIKRVSFRCQ